MATQGSTKDEPWKIDMLLGYKFSTIYFFSQAPIEFKQCSNVKFCRIQIIMAKICLHMHGPPRSPLGKFGTRAFLETGMRDL